MTTLYRVTHSTEYEYARPVSSSYGQLHLLPRELPGQRCRRSQVRVDPAPELYRERLDFFGNRVGYFALHRAAPPPAGHGRERRRGRTSRATRFSLFGQQTWERVR